MNETKPAHPVGQPPTIPEEQWTAVMERLAELERRIESLELRRAEVPAAPQDAAPVETAEPYDLERRFASPLLNYLGLIAMLVGLALLIGYWMEEHAARAILLACSSAAALIGLSGWMGRRGAKTFSETLEGSALGLISVACYLSYAWVGIVPSLAAAAAVTGLAIRRAMRRDSQLVILFVFLAALLGTLLLRSAHSGESLLFGYLAAINAGAVWAGGKKGWTGLRFLALLGSHFVAWFWYWTHPASQLALAALFPVVTFALFARYVPARELTLAETMLGIINSAAFLAASVSLLQANDPSLAPWTPLALALVHLSIGLACMASASLRPYARLHFWLGALLTAGGIAAAAVVLPAPWIALAWTAQAGVLGWLGWRQNNPTLRNAANLLGLAAAVALQFGLRSSGQAESRTVITAGTLVLAAFVAVQHLLSKKYPVPLGNWEWTTHWLLAAAGTMLPMVALSQQIAARAGAGGILSPSLATSLVWAAYSMGICLAGWFWVSAFLRWIGVALLLITTLKVFLVDTLTLSGVTRISSFLLLSLFLLLLSFLFQTRRR